MFRGASEVNLDVKGRLAIPTRYRTEILEKDQGKMICTAGFEHKCLLLYTLSEWNVIEEKLIHIPNIDPIGRRIHHLMIGYATECELDKSGRILLTSSLRRYAGLEKEVMLVGQLNKFEIWDINKWYAQIEEDASIGIDELANSSEELRKLFI